MILKMSASFEDFCNYIVTTAEDPDTDIDIEGFAEFFVNFIEPFAIANNIEIPEALLEFIEAITELDSDDEENSDGEDAIEDNDI